MDVVDVGVGVDVNMDVVDVVVVDRLASPLSSSFVPSVFLIDATRKRHLTYYIDRKLMALLFIKAKKTARKQQNLI